MSFVTKVSLPGYDVMAATPEQCAIHSSYPPLKSKLGQSNPHQAFLDLTFTATVTQGVTHTLYSFNHGYGYVPFSLASIIFYDGFQEIYGLSYAGIGSTLAINAYCTANDFIIDIYDDYLWTNYLAWLKVSYYIFAENGT